MIHVELDRPGITSMSDPPHWLTTCPWCLYKARVRFRVDYTQRRPFVCSKHRRSIARLVRRLNLPR